MTALPAELSALNHQPSAADSQHSSWISVPDAAVRLGCNAGHVRRLCREWSARGLARQVDGCWYVNPAADQRLRTSVDLLQRDRQQLAELSKSGARPAALDRAEALRDIVRGLDDFDCHAANPRQLREFYVAHLKALGLPAGVNQISVSRLYAWERLYREQGVAGLVRKSADRAARDPACGPAALDYIFNLVHCGNGISLAYAVELARNESARHGTDPAWKIPSYNSIRLAVNERSPTILRVLCNKGERSAKTNCLPKMQRGFTEISAGDEYVGDERTLDIWCRVFTSHGWRAIRPKWTVWECMRSRMIVGHVLGARANSRTILGSLKRAIRDHGKPLLLRTDWGEDYKSVVRHGLPKRRRPAASQSDDGRPDGLDEFDGPRISGVLDQLGIQVRRTNEPYSPNCKPIESFFRTQKNRFDRLFPDFWGGCASERHEDRARYLRENLHKLPTLDDVSGMLAQCIESYHHHAHSAPDMFGKTPLEAMAAFREGPVRAETSEVLDHLFREFVGPKLIRRDGVRWNAHWYGNGDARLVSMRDGRRKVLLAIQPEDQGRAMVCELDRTPLFEVECAPLLGRTREQVGEFMADRRRMLRPFKDTARAAKRFMAGITPQAVLDDAARAVDCQNPGRQSGDSGPTRLTVVRPALQQAIEQAEPAPIDAASKVLRTGTDDDEVTLDDFIGGIDPVEVGVLTDPSADGAEDLSWSDFTGELG